MDANTYPPRPYTRRVRGPGTRRRALGLCLLLGLALAPAESRAQNPAGVLLSLPTATGHRGDRVEVAVQLSGLAGHTVASGQFQLRYDGALLDFAEVVTAGSPSAGWLLKSRVAAEGGARILHLGFAGLGSASNEGPLLRLVFRVAPAAPVGAFTPLKILAAQLEEDTGSDLSPRTQDGLFRVGAAPVLWTNTGLTLGEGLGAPVTTALLAVQDVDNPPSELAYSLLAIPAVGQLTRGPVSLGLGATFTQADIDRGDLRYLHDGSETTSDAFAFGVTDGNGGRLEGTFAITITPRNDRPTLDLAGDLLVDEGTALDVVFTARDPDGTPSLAAHALPAFASFADHADGTGTLHLAPGYTAAGVYPGLQIVATDGADPALTDTRTLTLTVKDVNRPPLASAGGDAVLPYATPAATPVTLNATGSSDPDGQSLSYRWLEAGAQVATGPTPTVALPFGTHTLTLVVSDGQLEARDEVVVRIVDGTPPALSLLGDDPLFVELGTPYREPGVTAADEIDGDLTAAIAVEGAVDERTEGRYTLTYRVVDRSGNPALAERAVEVVVTPNSYALIATNSIRLRERAAVRSGFVGVVDLNRGGRVELVIDANARTGKEVRVSAPRVRLGPRSTIEGTLVYTALVRVQPTSTIGRQEQVPLSYWPLFDGFGLPAFEAGAPRGQNIEVRPGQRRVLSPGNYGLVRVYSSGTLVLTGGTYDLRQLDVGTRAQVLVQAPATLRVKETLELGARAAFGPESGGADPAGIRVYVDGASGKSEDGDDRDASGVVARLGEGATFAGNLYAPRGAIDLGSKAQAQGSFIARDLIVGTEAEVALRSGWQTSGVLYAPPPSLPPAARPAADLAVEYAGGEEELLVGVPNPFNPATTLHYALPDAGSVELAVYSSLGQRVRVLVDGVQTAGSHVVEWDGRDDRGQAVASGVYLARLHTNEMRQVRRLLLLR